MNGCLNNGCSGCSSCGNWGCGNWGCNIWPTQQGNSWTFGTNDQCIIPINQPIDDSKIAPNCSCGFRCCICGGWCGANNRCTSCGNCCIHNCSIGNCGCNQGIGCGCNQGSGCGCGTGCNTQPGRVCVRILNATTGAGVPGATVELVDANQNVVGTKTTDSQGMVCFENLRLGSYFVNVTAVPAGYNPVTASILVTLNQCQCQALVDIPVTGSAIVTGTIAVVAVSAASQTTTLPGATITLFDAGNNPVGTTTTDANGLAIFSNVPVGTYSAIASSAPAGYNLPILPVSVVTTTAMPSVTVLMPFPPLV